MMFTQRFLTRLARQTCDTLPSLRNATVTNNRTTLAATTPSTFTVASFISSSSISSAPPPGPSSSSSSSSSTSASRSSSSSLIRAYKSPTGLPVELLLKGDALVHAKQELLPYYSLTMTPRQTCDVEMLLNGAFTPLDGFMTKQHYDNVVNSMRLSDGTLFPMPITLDVTAQQASAISQLKERSICLRDVEGNAIAILDIEDIWTPDKQNEAKLCFTGDLEHPAVDYLTRTAGTVYIGGKLRGIQLPHHYDHADLRLTPLATRTHLPTDRPVVAFQTRNPLHRAHFELTRAAQQSLRDPVTGEEGFLLLHPVVGMTKPGDIDYQTRVKCYRALLNRYPANSMFMTVIPLAMRMAGPREALLHAIIRQNYGASHFIIGRDHAGPGENSKKVPFYQPYDARDIALSFQKELDIKLMPFEQMVYVVKQGATLGTYVPVHQVPAGAKSFNLSGTEVRRRLSTGDDIPEWFSFSEVVSILRKRHPPRHRQGVCLFFTGLSGSGKSTVAAALRERLMQLDDERHISLLDGDEMRHLISSELGFSKEHRNLNIRRIGFICSQIVACKGLAIACPIAPYTESRKDARRFVTGNGGAFVEIYMQANVDVCSARDRKGLYAKAKLGLVKNLTGVDDPYEPPHNAEITVVPETNVADAVDQIVKYLHEQGYVRVNEN